MGPNGNYFGTGYTYANQGVKRNKIKFAAIFFAVLLAIGGIVGFIIKQNNDRRNYIYEQADILYTELVWTRTSTQCDMMVRNADLLYIPNDRFNGYVEECRQSAEKIQESLNNLKDASTKQEYIDLYNIVAVGVESDILLGDELIKAIDTYNGWRTFLLYEEEGLTLTVEDVAMRVEELNNANSEVFSDWLSKWQKAKENLLNISIIKDTNAENEAKYRATELAYEKIMGATPDFHNNYSLGHKLPESSTLGKDVMALYSYIKENI